MSTSAFINAENARKNARDNGAIHAEIRTIESFVLANVDAGSLSTTVSNCTVMTNSTVYYNVFNGVTDDPTKLDQLNYVKQYFLDLGYGVNIRVNSVTNNTLNWYLTW